MFVKHLRQMFFLQGKVSKVLKKQFYFDSHLSSPRALLNVFLLLPVLPRLSRARSHLNCKMYLSQIENCICLKLITVFVSNWELYLSQSENCSCLKMQNLLLPVLPRLSWARSHLQHSTWISQTRETLSLNNNIWTGKTQNSTTIFHWRVALIGTAGTILLLQVLYCYSW